MRINSDHTRTFLYITATIIILTLCASTLIGSEQYLEDRNNHRNTQQEEP